MRPAVGLAELEKLVNEASSFTHADTTGSRFSSWQSRVRTVFAQSFGGKRDQLKRFDDVSYSPSFFFSGAPDSLWSNAFASGIAEAVGLLEGAIYELKLAVGDEPVDEHAYDPELWAHVKTQVEDGEWGKVASQTAIFVENHVRTWAGEPKDNKGNNLVGKALYLEVFGDSSDYRLGKQASEREGWRYLGMGFAQALSNVDRHRIQKRDDAKRRALGVLGLGSLLLTQMRYEHAEIFEGRVARGRHYTAAA